jgi:Cd2+/Zn2+-exporting ATPase
MDRDVQTRGWLGRFIEPTREVFNPVLADDTVIDADEGSPGVFLTPGAQRIEAHLEIIIALGAGTLLLAAWILSLAGGPRPLQDLLTLLAFAAAGVPAIKSVWESLRAFKIDIDVLMLLAAFLAAAIGSPFEGALLLFLFALSGGLEGYALGRTQAAIHALRDLAPKEATLVDQDDDAAAPADTGRYRRVPLRFVPVGVLILVRPGEKIPVDGQVVDGASAVDESSLTGESVPQDRGPGDTVFAGTQNKDGRLLVRVTKLAADTTLAKVVALVSEARQQTTSTQRLIDRIGPTYSTSVILATIAVGLAGWLLFGLSGEAAARRAITLMIVASPCALIIATPVAYLSAIAAAARKGVLIKGGRHLETIATARTFVFDKTGTLTRGNMRLVEVIPPAGMSEPEVLRHVGAVETSSTHPLASAVMAALADQRIEAGSLTDYLSEPGQGVAGTSDGRRVWVGRPETLGNAETPKRGNAGEGVAAQVSALRATGKTVSAFTIGGAPGLLAFEDTIRDGSRACIDGLRAGGVSHLEMLTGDHEVVAAQVAGRLGLDGFRAGLDPKAKLDAAREMRDAFGTIVMVGDGVNDAAVLAGADTGIAMAGIGADVALDAADIVLMKDRIEAVAWLRDHALRTRAVVRQNLSFALGVIGVLSVFAVLGSIPLPLAVIGHEGSTVLVALNALRLLRNGR